MTKIGFQDRLSLNAGQKYSAILSTFIKPPFVIKIFVLSILSDRFRQVLLYGICVTCIGTRSEGNATIHLLKCGSLRSASFVIGYQRL